MEPVLYCCDRMIIHIICNSALTCHFHLINYVLISRLTWAEHFHQIVTKQHLILSVLIVGMLCGMWQHFCIWKNKKLQDVWLLWIYSIVTLHLTDPVLWTSVCGRDLPLSSPLLFSVMFRYSSSECMSSLRPLFLHYLLTLSLILSGPLACSYLLIS